MKKYQQTISKDGKFTYHVPKELNDKNALCMGIVCLVLLEQNDDGKELLKKFGISIEGANEEND